MPGQGSRIFKAMGKGFPLQNSRSGKSNTKSGLGRPSTRRNAPGLSYDDADSLSSCTPSECHLLCLDWKQKTKIRHSDQNNNTSKEVSASAPLKIKQSPARNQAVIASTEKVNSWLDKVSHAPKEPKAVSSRTPNSDIESKQGDDFEGCSKANTPRRNQTLILNSPTVNGTANIVATPTSTASPFKILKSTSGQDSSAVMISGKGDTPRCNQTQILKRTTVNGAANIRATPTSTASPFKILKSSNDKGSSAVMISGKGVTPRRSPRITAQKIINNPTIPSVEASSTSKAASSRVLNCNDVTTFSPTETLIQLQYEDFITPDEPNSNTIIVQLEKNDNQPVATMKASSRGCSVRKNLFPSDNEDGIFIDANESLASHLDRFGGSISLVVDANTTELVPDTSSLREAEDIEMEEIDATPEEPVTENNNINNSKKRKRTVEVSDKTPPKKRRVNKDEWKVTKARVASQSGIAHVSRRGKVKRAKALQPPCGAKCRKECTSRISEEVRSKLLTKYWGLADKVSQWMFLSKLIKTIPIKRRKVIVVDEDEAWRKHTYEYHLCDPDEKIATLFPVCQTMFLATFDISVSVIKTSLVKNSPDKRGKHIINRKRLSPILINSVKDHIKQFPLLPSHYCRADSRRKYLDENLTVAKMHRLYLLTRNTDEPFTATLRQYRDIFNTCFNLSFFRPKKDQCSLCLEFDSPSPGVERSNQLIQKYNKHQQEKKRIRELKRADKQASRDKELARSSGNNSRTVTFDLEKVLYCPKAENAELFYRRKLSCFNFTLYDCTVKQAYNYFWDITIGKKGSNEISTFVLDYLQEMVKIGINNFNFYSDSCSGQNKNQYLFAMYYMAAMRFKIKITHRWLVKGHTQMECDSVHARIEKKTRNVTVYTPMQWFGLIATAKVKKPAYKVKKVTTDSILSFRELESIFKWDKVPITQLREICFDHEQPGFISYRKECDGQVTKFEILAKRRGRPINWVTYEWKKAYSDQLTVKPKVLGDLKWYVKKGLIPEAHLNFYNSLFEPVAAPAPSAAAEEITDSDEEDDTPQEVVRNDVEDLLVEHSDDEEEEEVDNPDALENGDQEIDDDASTDSDC